MQEIIEVLRVLLVVFGVVLIGFIVREARIYKGAPSKPWMLGSLCVFGMCLVVEELSRIGRPVSWRLPAYAVGLALAFVGLLKYRRGRRVR